MRWDRVQATDNIGITKVRVLVQDEAGKTLEFGDAIRAEGDRWEYVPRAEGTRILAKAFDLPGNCTKLELLPPPPFGHLPQIRNP